MLAWYSRSGCRPRGVRWVPHELMPLRQSLQTVHHGAIVSIGRREQEEAEQAQVELEEGWLLPPRLAILWDELGHLTADGLCLHVFDTHLNVLACNSDLEVQSMEG